MNSTIISIVLILVIIIVGNLLSNFFEISDYLYMPYIVWGVGLCVLNIILEKVHINKFMEGID